jgi:GntR family transcriptional regulator
VAEPASESSSESDEARFNRARREAAGPARVQKSPRRVHAMLRTRIEVGDLAANDVLIEEEIMRTYGTSRNAVREALAMLADDGLVHRSPRIGTTVVSEFTSLTVEGFHAPMAHERWRTTTSPLESSTVPSSPLLRSVLATTDEELTMEETLVRVDDEPLCVYTSYRRTSSPALPLRFSDPDWTLTSAFEAAYGVPLEIVDTTVQAMGCEPRTARRLGLEPGAPVLVRSRLLMDATETFREFSYTYWVDGRVALRARTRLSVLRATD